MAPQSVCVTSPDPVTISSYIENGIESTGETKVAHQLIFSMGDYS